MTINKCRGDRCGLVACGGGGAGAGRLGPGGGVCGGGAGCLGRGRGLGAGVGSARWGGASPPWFGPAGASAPLRAAPRVGSRLRAGRATLLGGGRAQAHRGPRCPFLPPWLNDTTRRPAAGGGHSLSFPGPGPAPPPRDGTAHHVGAWILGAGVPEEASQQGHRASGSKWFPTLNLPHTSRVWPPGHQLGTGSCHPLGTASGGPRIK